MTGKSELTTYHKSYRDILRFFITVCLISIIFGVAILFPFPAESASQLSNPFYILEHRFGFDDGSIRRFRQGEVITRRLDSDAEAELVVVGGVYLKVPSEFFIEYSRDVVQIHQTGQGMITGKFSSPPIMSDLDGLTFDESDLKAARECQTGKCDLKLPQDMINRFQSIRSLDMIDFDSAVTAEYKKMMLRIVQGYLEKGSDTLPVFADQSYRLNIGKEFRDIVKSSDLIRALDENIIEYFLKYPNCELQDKEEFFYWVKQVINDLRPITAVKQTAIFKTSGNLPTIIAHALLYASHYYEGSLENYLIFSDSFKPDKGGCYLLFIKRSRFDTLRRGGFLGIIKSKLRSGVEEEVGISLKLIKAGVERKYSERNGNID